MKSYDEHSKHFKNLGIEDKGGKEYFVIEKFRPIITIEPMQFNELVNKAIETRNAYDKINKTEFGKVWSKEHFAQGLVGDVGDLMKIIMAKEGVKQIENADEKLAHELSDCLWSIIILAKLYDINLEESFIKNMDKINAHIQSK